VKDLARLLWRNAVKSVQIKGLEVQILPLEPFDAAALRSALLMAFGLSNRRRKQKAQPRRMEYLEYSAYIFILMKWTS
jgi:hypothetical protein